MLFLCQLVQRNCPALFLQLVLCHVNPSAGIVCSGFIPVPLTLGLLHLGVEAQHPDGSEELGRKMLFMPALLLAAHATSGFVAGESCSLDNVP